MNPRIISFTALLLATACPAAAFAEPAATPSATGASSADAQSAATAPAGAPASDEILVTARRTNERIQDVPVAVTAVSAQQLQAQHITSVSDVQRLSPSLSITPLNGVGTSATVAIRGQVQTTAGIGVDPSTGVYINEVYVARPAGLDAAIYDLENVQVLKGPQGTLFGRSAVGGALLIQTAQPTDHFGGYLDAAVEAPYGYSVQGAINIPLTANVDFRLAGTREYNRGYTQVLNSNERLDDRNRYGARATLRISVGSFTSTTYGDIYHSSANGAAGFPLPSNPAIANPATPVYATYIADYNASLTRGFHQTTVSGPSLVGPDGSPVGGKATTGGISNTTAWEIAPHVTLKNILGYRFQRSDDFVDLDGTLADIQYVEVNSDTHQFSEELQLQSNLLNDSLALIGGAYYFSEGGHDYSNSWTRVSPLSVARNQNRFDAHNTSWAFFGHANYTLPIGIPAHIFGGIRYTEDTRHVNFESRTVNAAGAFTCTVVGATNCSLLAQKTFPATTWDVGADVRPVTGVMLYASVSRGYRTGGFNGRATTVVQQVPFEPEFATSYETGIKTDWTIGGVRGRLNADVFTADYTNIQRATIVTSGSSVSGIVINAAKARIRGVELEGSLRFGRDFTLTGFYSAIDAEYKQFLIGTTDLSANEFSFVPRHQAGATADWLFARTERSGNFGVNVNYSHKSGFFLDVVNFPTARTQAYDLINASVRWENVLGSRVTAEIYAHNLFDKNYDSGGFSLATTVGVAEVMHGPPRVVGFALHVPFGD